MGSCRAWVLIAHLTTNTVHSQTPSIKVSDVANDGTTVQGLCTVYGARYLNVPGYMCGEFEC